MLNIIHEIISFIAVILTCINIFGLFITFFFACCFGPITFIVWLITLALMITGVNIEGYGGNDLGMLGIQIISLILNFAMLVGIGDE